MFATISLLATSAAVPALPPAAPVAFSVGGRRMQMPLLPALCVPSGTAAGIAQALAADDRNVTRVSLLQCDGSSLNGASGYVLIKTPTQLLLPSFDRPAFLRSLANAFQTPELKGQIDSAKIQEEVSKRPGDQFGGDVNLTGSVKPPGV